MPIRRLDRVLIDRIAAGEVVERPASVVKELVENALDAGATRIDIVVEGGGRRLIRISDNGSGMTASDLDLAVERHATSKLPDGDLANIAMFGFRGEALPSIASVARVRIATRTRDADYGSVIEVDAGLKGPIRPGAHNVGTQVEVHDLFSATPARLKFLKSDRAESRAIADMVNRLAMAHPQVRLSLAGAETAGFDYQACAANEAGSLQRVVQILGRNMQDNALELHAAREHVALAGFAGLPTWHRGDAAGLFLFVNGRSVRDKLLVGSIRAAYADFLPSGRYPTVVLFLSCDPAEVDVNVHPAKAEVRFRDSGLVRGLIVGALKQAITGAMHRAAGTGEVARHFQNPFAGAPADWRAEQSASAPPTMWRSEGFSAPPQASFTGVSAVAEHPLEAASAIAAEDFPLGIARTQVHGNYLVTQTKDGIVIVDQHAAHERLVYERLKAQRSTRAVAIQGLLIPSVVELEPRSAERLIDQAEHLRSLGLSIESFGIGAVLVRETPAVLGNVNVDRLVRDLADAMADDDVDLLPLERRLDHYLATFACHHSVRSGRQLNREEMDALLRAMEATPGSGQCNHGRPTYVELKLTDIERLFGRR